MKGSVANDLTTTVVKVENGRIAEINAYSTQLKGKIGTGVSGLGKCKLKRCAVRCLGLRHADALRHCRKTLPKTSERWQLRKAFSEPLYTSALVIYRD